MITYLVTHTSVVNSRKVTIVYFSSTYRNVLASRYSSCVVFQRRSVQPQNWFSVFQLIPRQYKYYHFRTGRGLQVAWSPYINLFLIIYALESYSIIHGWIQEIHLTKSLFPFSHRLTLRERRRSETLAILNCGWQQ